MFRRLLSSSPAAGCSSLLAMMSENGPFRPDPTNPSRLVEDDYAWNRVANVIWLESPAGVGFSFSKTPGDYINVGDARTANDTFVFLQTFFRDLFPQFRNNSFYITGESYGGHYVPTASLRVLEGNDRREGVHINIKGMIERNAWTNMRKGLRFLRFASCLTSDRSARQSGRAGDVGGTRYLAARAGRSGQTALQSVVCRSVAQARRELRRYH